MGESRNITWQEIRYLVPLIGGLATIIFFLASISFRIDAVQTQQIEAKAQLVATSDTINTMRTTQNIQGQDIAVIKQILQHNNLTKANTPNKSNQLALAITPSKTNTSATFVEPTKAPVVTNNTTYIVQPTTTPERVFIAPTNVPQPTPKPTPQPIVCVLTLCI